MFIQPLVAALQVDSSIYSFCFATRKPGKTRWMVELAAQISVELAAQISDFADAPFLVSEPVQFD